MISTSKFNPFLCPDAADEDYVANSYNYGPFFCFLQDSKCQNEKIIILYAAADGVAGSPVAYFNRFYLFPSLSKNKKGFIPPPNVCNLHKCFFAESVGFVV